MGSKNGWKADRPWKFQIQTLTTVLNGNKIKHTQHFTHVFITGLAWSEQHVPSRSVRFS